MIFAARLEGSAGELLLDDLAYVVEVGPVLRLGPIRLEEDPKLAGKRCTVSTSIENAGDVRASGVRAAMDVPPGLEASPREIPIGELPPDVRRPVTWTLDGERPRRGRLGFSATAGSEQVSASLGLAPKLEVQSFGPTSPVAAAGQPTAIECVLTNTGTASVLGPTAEFTLEGNTAEARAERCPPGSSLVLQASFRPRAQMLRTPATVRVSCQGMHEPITMTSSLVVGAASPLPPSSGTLRATVERGGPSAEVSRTPVCAVLENEHLRLAFRRNDFGFGPGEIAVKTGSGWKTVACLPRLSRIVFQDGKATRQERDVCASDEPDCTVDHGRSARMRFVGTCAEPARSHSEWS